MPAIALVAVGRLNEDGAVTEALGKHFPSNVVQPHASTCGEAGQARLGHWSLHTVALRWSRGRWRPPMTESALAPGGARNLELNMAVQAMSRWPLQPTPAQQAGTVHSRNRGLFPS